VAYLKILEGNFSEFTISECIILEMYFIVMSMASILFFVRVNKVFPILPLVLMVFFVWFSCKNFSFLKFKPQFRVIVKTSEGGARTISLQNDGVGLGR